MTPQQHSIAIAKLLYELDRIAHGLLWCAFMMNSWDNIEEVFIRADRTIVSMADVTSGTAFDPQLKLLREIRRSTSSPNPVNWRRVQRLARKLIESVRSDCSGLPESESTLLDLLEGVSPECEQRVQPAKNESSAQAKRRARRKDQGGRTKVPGRKRS
jgi:hypothetical protein